MADVPIGTMVPTHLNRRRELLLDSVRYGKLGGFLDITTSIELDSHNREAVDPVEAVDILRHEGILLEQISLSTDAGGSAPVFDVQGHLVHMGIGSAKSLWRTVRELHRRLGWAWNEAIRPATETPARILKLNDVGRIQVGGRGDLMLTDENQVVTVIGGGRVLVRDGHVVARGMFERVEDAHS